MEDLVTASTAWKDAQEACFNYLVTGTGYQEGLNAFLGDRLPNSKANLFCFIVSGGRDQTQNYQSKNPSYSWYSNAILRGQFIKMEDAMDYASKVQDIMPAYKNPDKEGQVPSGHVKNRGIQPNVNLFEITNHPELFSDLVEVDGKLVQYWVVIINFRVVYNRKQI